MISKNENSSRDKSSTLLNVFIVIYWVSIGFAVLNYGAVELISITMFAVPTFLLLMISVLWLGPPRNTRHVMACSVLALALVLAWIAFQTSEFIGKLIGHPAWQDVREYARGVLSVASLTPADDWASVVRIAVPFGVFMLGLRLFDTDNRATSALKLLAISGGIISILSIMQFQLAPKALLFGAKHAYLDSLTGFFVNRNTAATYFGLVTLLNFSMFCRAVGGVEMRRLIVAIDQQRPVASDQKRQILLAFTYGLLLLSSLIALMLTKSRAGIGASLAAIVLLTLFMSSRPAGRSTLQGVFVKKGLHKVRRFAIAILLSVTVAFVFLSLAGRAILRAEVQGTDDDRFCVLPGILAGVADHFPWGSGPASFVSVFPAYRNASCGIVGVWNRAHSFYLEGLFTFGAMFAVLLLATLVLLMRTFFKGIRSRRRLRYAPEVGFASLLLLMIHSAFDFSLQISGLAIIYAAMLAPIVTICLSPPGGKLLRRRRRGQVNSILDPSGEPVTETEGKLRLQ